MNSIITHPLPSIPFNKLKYALCWAGIVLCGLTSVQAQPSSDEPKRQKKPAVYNRLPDIDPPFAAKVQKPQPAELKIWNVPSKSGTAIQPYLVCGNKKVGCRETFLGLKAPGICDQLTSALIDGKVFASWQISGGIPGLDGGYVIFLLFEMITGRKVSEKVMERATTVGLVLLLTLMVYANGLDIFRLFKK